MNAIDAFFTPDGYMLFIDPKTGKPYEKPTGKVYCPCCGRLEFDDAQDNDE